MKMYIIMLSKYYPATHPQAGKPTFFREKLDGALLPDGTNWHKLHTIRANWKLWAGRLYDVRNGVAELSIRQWTGKPYRSKTVEIKRLGQSDGVGVQMLRFDKDRDGNVSWNFFDIDGKYPEIKDVAFYDGLSLEDWKAWLKDYDLTKPMAVIQFTKFRY